MGLGSTAKKLQMVSESAEKMYKQVQELQSRIISLEEEVDDTHQTVTKMDHQLTEQRALLVAIAEEQGLDAEELLADVAIDEAEASTEEEAAEDEPDDGETTATEATD